MFAMAPTDLDWFEQLQTGNPCDFVNFWTPTDWKVKGLSGGDRLYFMLKAPIRKVGGYGHFYQYRLMPTSNAWKEFGLGNGVYNQAELVERTQKYAAKHVQGYVPSNDPEIGCIVLSNAVFFDEDDYFTPESYGFQFAKQVVKLKYFPEADDIPHATSSNFEQNEFSIVPPVAGAKRRVPVKDRKGQPGFRNRVLAAYKKRCAVTGIRTVEVLEAAHIQPYVDERSNHIQNGICLRVDLHRLFDNGLFSITDDFKIIVSKKLSDGPYSKIDGRSLRLPKKAHEQPSKAALGHHRQEFFVG
jgi:putative restriction endonuclease